MDNWITIKYFFNEYKNETNKMINFLSVCDMVLSSVILLCTHLLHFHTSFILGIFRLPLPCLPLILMVFDPSVARGLLLVYIHSYYL